MNSELAEKLFQEYQQMFPTSQMQTNDVEPKTIVVWDWAHPLINNSATEALIRTGEQYAERGLPGNADAQFAQAFRYENYQEIDVTRITRARLVGYKKEAAEAEEETDALAISSYQETNKRAEAMINYIVTTYQDTNEPPIEAS